jgi:hypothetical protein
MKWSIPAMSFLWFVAGGVVGIAAHSPQRSALPTVWVDSSVVPALRDATKGLACMSAFGTSATSDNV